MGRGRIHDHRALVSRSDSPLDDRGEPSRSEQLSLRQRLVRVPVQELTQVQACVDAGKAGTVAWKIAVAATNADEDSKC